MVVYVFLKVKQSDDSDKTSEVMNMIQLPILVGMCLLMLVDVPGRKPLGPRLLTSVENCGRRPYLC